ncbi:MAG TPA: LCP family protein [Patescibacteria group bacterium]|nr:LCP family protein [Patescibacteria group bacterium]
MANLDGINSNPEYLGVQRPRKPKSKLKKFAIFIVVLAILGGLGFAAAHYLGEINKIFTGKTSIFTRVGGLFISNDKPLIGEDTGTVNVLLLGVGGEGHDGAYLTDTMIVASINIKTNEVVLTSIPRDWVYQIPGHGLNKINAVYAFAQQDNPNDPNAAGEAVIAAAENITGFNIPYYAEIDFKGFVQAVDHVGGIDVTVDRTFSDSTFPNDFPYDTKGYLSTVTFNKGPQHMDGRTALIFARSRHGTNGEGSDFARSERQKKVILAMKDKLLGLNITNIATLNSLLSDFTSNFKTNLEPYELLRLADIAKNISGANVYSLSLEPQANLICDTTIDQLTGRPYIAPAQTQESTSDDSTDTTKSSDTKTDQSSDTSNSQETSPPPAPTQIPMYIVEPCSGRTLADVHQFLTDYWDVARLKSEGATIEVQNSTGKSAAATAWKNLDLDGVTINFATYTGHTPFDRTIIYDNSKGSKPRTLQYLESHFTLSPADVTYPSSKADFVIVLGNDAL